MSRFADKLISRIPELEKRTIKKKLFFIFTDRVDEYVFNQILEPDSFLHSINKVVNPIRKVVSGWKHDFNGEFTQGCQKKSVPIQFLTLIIMPVDGNVSNLSFSQGALTMYTIDSIVKYLYFYITP